jgi:hypothetical protein
VRCHSACGGNGAAGQRCPSPDRISPNSGSTAPLLGNTDSSHCACKAAHGHILAVDTHVNFPIEKTTERSWR